MIAGVLEQVTRASMLGHQGQRTAVRDLLDAAGPPRPPGRRCCAVAHALADVQEDLADEQAWDERALAEVVTAASEPVPAGLPPIDARLPPLQLNLADVHRRTGDVEAARSHVAAGREALAGDPQPHVAAALDRIAEALAR